jgi:hypothetical protein
MSNSLRFIVANQTNSNDRNDYNHKNIMMYMRIKKKYIVLNRLFLNGNHIKLCTKYALYLIGLSKQL